MSENEIKPVAWYVRWDAPDHREDGRRTDLSFSERHVDEQAEFDLPSAKLVKVGLYDQSAIDRLTAERDAAVADAERYRWLRKSRLGPQRAAFLDAETADQLDTAIDAARSEGGV